MKRKGNNRGRRGWVFRFNDGEERRRRNKKKKERREDGGSSQFN